MVRLHIITGLFIHHQRKKSTTFNYVYIIPHLTQADFVTGSMNLKPLHIMKIDKNKEIRDNLLQLPRYLTM
jgi:hypothetical protein